MFLIWIALFVSAMLLLVGRYARINGLVAPAFAWLVYAVWEYLMYKRVLCSGECNIRVDLVVAYAALGWFTFRRFRRGTQR